MKISVENSQDRRYNTIKDVGATLTGLGAGYEIRKLAPKYLIRPVFENRFKAYTGTTDEQNTIIREKLQEVLNKINLKLPDDKKIKIQFIDNNYKAEKKHIEAVKRGLNACFDTNTRTVWLNKKMPVPGFHELAHAKDLLSGFLPACKDATRFTGRLFGFVLPVFAVCTNKIEENPEKPLNKVEKTSNFIRNNIGKLSLIAAAPKIILEASANYKGNKFAKEAKLPPEIFKLIRKTHRLSNISYLTGAALLAFSSYAAVKIKDFISSKA